MGGMSYDGTGVFRSARGRLPIRDDDTRAVDLTKVIAEGGACCDFRYIDTKK